MVNLTVEAFFLAVPTDDVKQVKRTICEVIESLVKSDSLKLEDGAKEGAYKLTTQPTQDPNFSRISLEMHVVPSPIRDKLAQANLVADKVNERMPYHIIFTTRLAYPAYKGAIA